MATLYWIGGTTDHETDWSNAGNWSGASVPVTGDTVIFDGRSSHNADAGLDQTGVSLDRLHVMPSYTGSIGAADAPLIIECSGEVILQGTGNYYLQCGNDANDAEIALLIVAASVDSIIGLSSQKNAAAGNVATFTSIVAQSGNLTMYGADDITETGAEAGTAYGTLYISSSDRDSDINVIIGNGCHDLKNDAAGTIHLGRGTLTNYSSAAAIYQASGSITVGGSAYDMDGSDDDIAVVHQFGGTFDWQPSSVSGESRSSASPSPTITTYRHYGGTLTIAAMLATSTTAPTISNYLQGMAAEIDLDNSYGNIAITEWLRIGGTQQLAPGEYNV